MRTTPSATVTALAIVTLPLAAASCEKHATLAECSALYERFLDLKLAEDPRTKTMTEAERAAARKALEPSVAGDSDVPGGRSSSW
jgi:hypothetical protein